MDPSEPKPPDRNVAFAKFGNMAAACTSGASSFGSFASIASPRDSPKAFAQFADLTTAGDEVDSDADVPDALAELEGVAAQPERAAMELDDDVGHAFEERDDGLLGEVEDLQAIGEAGGGSEVGVLAIRPGGPGGGGAAAEPLVNEEALMEYIHGGSLEEAPVAREIKTF